MKKTLSLLFIIFGIIFFTVPAHAANGNFSTAAIVTYTVNPSGVTHVKFAETLTNTTGKYYASSYKIHLGFQDIQNVVASDNGGVITPLVDKANGGEDVSLTFNTAAFGKGKTIPFSFSFDTKEVASLNGTIWEVNIPGLSHADDFDTFTVQVIVPSFFGLPTYIKPATGNASLVFTKEVLGKSGISLTFGDKQVYALNLTYNVQNTQLFPNTTEIALPPNTSYQHVEIDSISPRPDNVILDSDDNWLAQYHLAPSQKVKIKVIGKAYVSLTPTTQQLTQAQISLFTKEDQYWQTHDSRITTLAAKLKTPEAIFNYVVNNLQYDFARVSDTQERLGAVSVLEHPTQAVCLEFTDLFIALARAAGIPARELNGYGYTKNTLQRPLSLQKEVLHAWPEYYDTASHEWIMVDPTWENTTGGVDYFHTFDFDHLTLVIKGASSTYPIPVGGYKPPGQEGEKDVAISFSSDSVEPQPRASVSLVSPQEVTAGLPITAFLQFHNTGFVLFPQQTILANTSLGSSLATGNAPIPPFGSSSVLLTLGKTQLLTNTNAIIAVHFAGETLVKSIHVTLFTKQTLIVLGGLLLAVLSIIISIATRRARRLPIP